MIDNNEITLRSLRDPDPDKFSYTSISIYEKENNYYDGVNHGIDFSTQKKNHIDTEVNGGKPFYTALHDIFNLNTPSGLLFPAILYNIPGLLIFERPPVQKLIQYIDRPVDYITEESVPHTYNLPLPWQLYVAEYDPASMLLCKVHMYFMNESFKGKEQIMYMAPLPNFYANGLLCRPMFADMEDVEGYQKTLSGIMASAYDWVWNSGFNHDLMECPMTVYADKHNTLHDAQHLRSPVTNSWQRHLNPKDICKILSDWEKISIDNILATKWPNLSVSNLWDSEVEWFFEFAADYPFDASGEDCGSDFEDLEHYSNDYPVNLYSLKKNYSIMIKSLIESSDTIMRAQSPRGISFKTRFNIYNRLSV